MINYQTFKTTLSGLALSCLAWTAGAQELPHRLHILVPFSAGGPIDFTARVLGEALRDQTGIPVIIENRPGANGAIAAVAVKRAPGDGETLLMASSGMLTISPHIEKNLQYDPHSDFAPVTTVAYSDVAMVVHPSVPASDLKEFVTYANEAKLPLAFGSAGTGNITHGYIELLKDATGVELLHVPYKGASLALADVLGGQITGTFVGLSAAMPHIKDGKLKALGLVGNERSTAMPEIPTIKEQGYAGVEFLTWSGLLAPESTPPATTEAIAQAVKKALQQDSVKARLAAGGSVPWIIEGEQFGKSILDESSKWRVLIQDKKMVVE